MHNATTAQLAAAFTEWERRYREDPAEADAFYKKLKQEAPSSYGQAAAACFLHVLGEVQAAQPAA